LRFISVVLSAIGGPRQPVQGRQQIDLSALQYGIKKMSSVVSNLVEIRDLHFAYGKRAILSGLNMDFPRGKVVAVMGGSGSGKTTVLRLIGGQLRPSGPCQGARPDRA
jgi:phospholipid/cholesterol/gamma-HCH transport system ATP-binding protein